MRGRNNLLPKPLQLRILLFCVLQNRYFRIGSFPEGEKILIGRFRLFPVTHQCIGSAQLQVRKCRNRIAYDDSAMIENLLKFGGGFSASIGSKVSLSTEVGWIKGTE